MCASSEWNPSKKSKALRKSTQPLTAMADRVIGIRNGTVAYAHLNEHVTPVEEIEW